MASRSPLFTATLLWIPDLAALLVGTGGVVCPWVAAYVATDAGRALRRACST